MHPITSRLFTSAAGALGIFLYAEPGSARDPVVGATGQSLVIDQNNVNSPYAVSSGAQSFSTVYVGSQTMGVLTLNGGTLNTAAVGTLGGTSALNFNGGTLQAGASSATFLQGLGAAYAQAGGVVVDTQGNDVSVAQSITRDPALGSGGQDGGFIKNGSGTLTMTGTSNYFGNTLINAGILAVPGGTLGGNGSLTLGAGAGLIISGTGSVTGSNSCHLKGTLANPASIFMSSSGTLTIGQAAIGEGGPGSVTQSNGTVNVYTALYLGSNGGSGSYTLGSTGLLKVASGTVYVGFYGSGSFTQTGGSFQAYGDNVYLGYLDGYNGTYTLSTGNLYTGYTIVSAAANTGTFTQTGGLHFTTGLILTGASTSSQGTYNLDGGTLAAFQVSSGYKYVNGTSTFNFNGGTLQSPNASTAYFQGLTTANVRNGGAIFDTGSQNITVAQSLVHSGISGDAAVDGGLTKLGAGKMTITSASTYTGTTTISAGTLALSGSATLGGAGNISIAAGGNLDVTALTGGYTLAGGHTLSNSGTITGNLTIASGAILAGGTLNGLLTVNSGGLVTATGSILTVNSGVVNNGTVRLEHGASLVVGNGGTFTNNGTLDIITGSFSAPAGFTNNGIIVDSSVVQAKSAQLSGGKFTVVVEGYTGHTYQLQRSASLVNASCTNVGSTQTGTTGTALTFTDPSPTATQGFYRVQVDP